MLRAVPLPKRLTGLLEAESGFNDAPTVILVIAFSATTLDAAALGPLLAQMSYQLIVGGLIGLAIGGPGCGCCGG